MNPEKSTVRNFWPGLVVLLLIYSAYYLLYADNRNLEPQNKAVSHAIKIGIVFVIYLTGSLFLRKLPQPWLLQVWHLIHISLISLLISLWAWHFLVSPLPQNMRKLGNSIHEFLISPLLYLATGLLGRVAPQQPSRP